MPNLPPASTCQLVSGKGCGKVGISQYFERWQGARMVTEQCLKGFLLLIKCISTDRLRNNIKL